MILKLHFLMLLGFVFIFINASIRNPSSFDYSYPPIFLDEDGENQNKDTQSSNSISKVIIKLGSVSAVLCGGYYLGTRLHRYIKKNLQAANSNTTTSTDNQGVNIVFDKFSNVSSKHFEDIEKLKSDHEELWRVVHNIYDGQNEKVVKVEREVDNLLGLNESLSRYAIETDNKFALLTEKYDSVSNIIKNIESGLHSENENAIAIKESLSSDIRDLSLVVKSMKKELETIIDDRDQKLIERIRKFGEELKSVVKSKKKSK